MFMFPQQEDNKDDCNRVWKHDKGGFEVSLVKLFVSQDSII